jgi:hypothetical protein
VNPESIVIGPIEPALCVPVIVMFSAIDWAFQKIALLVAEPSN